MPLPELLANSPVPGTNTALTTLSGAIVTTPAAGTVETWTFAAGPPAALAQAGQFRIVVDNEICIDVTGGAGTSRQIQRGAEGSTVATHASGASVYHYPTAGALAVSLPHALFGTGADGDVTISGTVTLTRDMQYNNLTVNGTLNTAGFRPFVRGRLLGSGVISYSGQAGGTNGSHPSSNSGIYTSGGAGGNSTTTTGTAGTSANFATQLGGQGGAGGAGSGGAGGAAGANNQPSAAQLGVGVANLSSLGPFFLWLGHGVNQSGLTYPLAGGTSGGGGGGDGAGNGGGGGEGAGPCVVFALDASGWTGTIRSNGGQGGPGVGNGGGGGGGGGGFAALLARVLPTGAYTMQALGGAGGAGSGTGAAGSAGSAGNTMSALC